MKNTTELFAEYCDVVSVDDVTKMLKLSKVTVYKWEFSGLKIPYDTVLAADFADFEYAASAKSCCWAHVCEQ